MNKWTTDRSADYAIFYMESIMHGIDNGYSRQKNLEYLRTFFFPLFFVIPSLPECE